MNSKKEIVDRIMHLEQELSDAESELAKYQEEIDFHDIEPGMMFDPPDDAKCRVVLIVRTTGGKDLWSLGGLSGNPMNMWTTEHDQESILHWLNKCRYKKVGLISTNFNDSFIVKDPTPF